MTPFGKSVATELRSALVPIETASIVDYRHLDEAARALLRNALFYVETTSAIEAARDRALQQAHALALAIHEVGVQPQGISLTVDQARAEAGAGVSGSGRRGRRRGARPVAAKAMGLGF